MAKIDKKGKQISISANGKEVNLDAIANLVTPNEDFTGATIVDDFCNYTYDILKGIGEGNTHNVKGKAIVHEDLKNAMQVLDRHMACIDGAFKLSGTKFDNIDQLENDELTANYAVSGFKTKGIEDSLSVYLIGKKTVAPIGQMELKTPKVDITEMSSYQWHNELKEAIESLKREVKLYHEGKCEPKIDLAVNDPNQITMEVNFEDAKVD